MARVGRDLSREMRECGVRHEYELSSSSLVLPSGQRYVKFVERSAAKSVVRFHRTVSSRVVGESPADEIATLNSLFENERGERTRFAPLSVNEPHRTATLIALADRVRLSDDAVADATASAMKLRIVTWVLNGATYHFRLERGRRCAAFAIAPLTPGDVACERLGELRNHRGWKLAATHRRAVPIHVHRFSSRKTLESSEAAWRADEALRPFSSVDLRSLALDSTRFGNVAAIVAETDDSRLANLHTAYIWDWKRGPRAFLVATRSISPGDEFIVFRSPAEWAESVRAELAHGYERRRLLGRPVPDETQRIKYATVAKRRDQRSVYAIERAVNDAAAQRYGLPVPAGRREWRMAHRDRAFSRGSYANATKRVSQSMASSFPMLPERMVRLISRRFRAELANEEEGREDPARPSPWDRDLAQQGIVDLKDLRRFARWFELRPALRLQTLRRLNLTHLMPHEQSLKLLKAYAPWSMCAGRTKERESKRSSPFGAVAKTRKTRTTTGGARPLPRPIVIRGGTGKDDDDGSSESDKSTRDDSSAEKEIENPDGFERSRRIVHAIAVYLRKLIAERFPSARIVRSVFDSVRLAERLQREGHYDARLGDLHELTVAANRFADASVSIEDAATGLVFATETAYLHRIEDELESPSPSPSLPPSLDPERSSPSSLDLFRSSDSPSPHAWQSPVFTPSPSPRTRQSPAFSTLSPSPHAWQSPMLTPTPPSPSSIPSPRDRQSFTFAPSLFPSPRVWQSPIFPRTPSPQSPEDASPPSKPDVVPSSSSLTSPGGTDGDLVFEFQLPGENKP